MKSQISLLRGRQRFISLSLTHTHIKGRGSVIMCDHSDTGVVWPQAEECWQPIDQHGMFRISHPTFCK